jgi:hypothetical protein
MARPEPVDYAPFYETYVSLVQKDDLIREIHDSLTEIYDTLEALPIDKIDYAYAEGKWTVRQLLQHMIDTERVFSYRATAFARGDRQELPGFDENAWASAAPVNDRNFQEMKEELLILRRSVYFMYKGLTPEALQSAGEANKNRVTVNALGYIMVGHVRHHFRILAERYL